jgi:hypothetical protein
VLLQFSLDGEYMANGIALRADYDGHDRAEVAAIDGMDRQTLRDWVIAFNSIYNILNVRYHGKKFKHTLTQNLLDFVYASSAIASRIFDAQSL